MTVRDFVSKLTEDRRVPIQTVLPDTIDPRGLKGR